VLPEPQGRQLVGTPSHQPFHSTSSPVLADPSAKTREGMIVLFAQKVRLSEIASSAILFTVALLLGAGEDEEASANPNLLSWCAWCLSPALLTPWCWLAHASHFPAHR